jgi:hypothetical protein
MESRDSVHEPARALLLYRGRPVAGGYGIFADFWTKATNIFLDGLIKFGASQAGPLASMGPIPNREQIQFLITSTAPGSFGFELEEHRPGELPFGDATPAAQALEDLRHFLQTTLDTDDELADAVAGAEPRAVEAVREFLRILVVNEAICSLKCGNRALQFRDVGQVPRSLGRLSSDYLHEEERSSEREFQGLLPNRRSFEFKLTATDEIIGGKVGRAIENPDDINLISARPLASASKLHRSAMADRATYCWQRPNG